jgi:calcineurin-like phosphoesterase family protein
VFDFVYSDPHFGHKNVLKYDLRPWETIEEHDAALVERYNAVVRPEHHVLWLGDCFFVKREPALAIMSSLRGRKTLVMGNHDRWTVTQYRAVGFEAVHKNGLAWERFWCSHRPEPPYPHRMRWNLHGHTHAPLAYRATHPDHVCCSVTAWNYAPAPVEEIKKNS